MTGGSGSIRRRGKRRVRCIRKGHGWYQYARREGDLIVTKQRCIRCGRDRTIGVRPFNSQAKESTTAARATSSSGRSPIVRLRPWWTS